MRICTIAGADVRCGPLFGLLCIFAVVSGNFDSFAMYLGAVALHEAAHGMMAGMLGYRIQSVDLQPYGCAACISRLNSWFDEMLIALAGPVFSALVSMGCDGFMGWPAEFARANMYIAAVNLLPVYPLDGGRAARALLQLMDVSVPGVVRMAVAVGISLLAAAAGWLGKNLTVIIFAVFLFASALSEDSAECSAAASHIRRARALSSGGAVEVKHVAIWRGVSLTNALSNIGGSRYVVVLVLDEDMKVVGSIEGERLVQLAARLGGDKKLGDAAALIDRTGG